MGWLFFWSCEKNEETPATFDPTPYALQYGDFPTPNLPADNIPTLAGVKLGRMLFYEKKLSKDGTQACADCHRQPDSFSDTTRFSIGVEKLPGKRQAMALMNLAWHNNGMFWDGRSPSIRDQALRPIQDPLEMNEKLENVISKLKADKKYTDQFIRAFGSDTITSEKIGLAIEQFELTMISNQSRYDQYLKGTVTLNPDEERGRKIFFTEFDPSGVNKGGECFHCHGGHNFTNDDYMNNGLDTEAGITDEGKMKVSGLSSDRGKFKVPSLRNIALTPPYMHDGRFKTLREVIDHYNTGVKLSSTVDGLLQYNLQPGGLKLSEQDISDLIAFLHTLSDTQFTTEERFTSPF